MMLKEGNSFWIKPEIEDGSDRKEKKGVYRVTGGSCVKMLPNLENFPGNPSRHLIW